MKDSLDKRAGSLQGGVLHVQGLAFFSQGYYGDGLKSFLESALSFAMWGHEGQIQTTLEAIIDQGLPKITNKTINNPEYQIEESFHKLISVLEKNNDGGRYSRWILKLNVEWKKATERSPNTTGRNP